MTNEEFCKNDSSFYGEKVDNIKQIALRTFNGEELKEYVEHQVKNSVVLAGVIGSNTTCGHEWEVTTGKCVMCGKSKYY